MLNIFSIKVGQLKLSEFFAPAFMIPLALITPYVFLGDVGVTIFELFIVTGFFSIIFKKRKAPKERFLVIYLVLMISGYFFALINGIVIYGMTFSFGDLKVGYWSLLAISGFSIGKNYFQNIEGIGNSSIFKIILFVLCIFIISYPFLNTDLKYLIMSNFYSSNLSSSDLNRIDSLRFPGLGINSNIYAFMLLICFHISLYSVFKGVVSWIYPLLLFFAICICASKTVLILALFLFFVMFIFDNKLKRKIRMKFLILIILSLPLIIYFVSSTSIGKEFINNIVIIDRLIELSEDRSDYGYENSYSGRTELWSMGVERVMLSPFFGIKLSNKSDDDRIINFCCPHNEFIAYWTFMGILGLLSYFTLICSIIRKNKNSKNALFWYLLYFALVVQMFFDSAFQNVRFIPLFFILVGINISELKINKF
jgi:hypothetical protein